MSLWLKQLKKLIKRKRDQATSNNDVDQTNGINIINSIDADVIKSKCKKLQNKPQKLKRRLINQNSDATQEEKDAAIQRKSR